MTHNDIESAVKTRKRIAIGLLNSALSAATRDDLFSDDLESTLTELVDSIRDLRKFFDMASSGKVGEYLEDHI